MNLNDYQTKARRTGVLEHSPAVFKSHFFFELFHCTLGMNTEVSELSEAVTLSIFRGQPVDKVNISEELSDILWYPANFFESAGISFAAVANSIFKDSGVLELYDYQTACNEVLKGDKIDSPFLDGYNYELIHTVLTLSKLTGDFTDIIKRLVYYVPEGTGEAASTSEYYENRLYIDALKTVTSKIIMVIASFCDRSGISFDLILENNIEKLKKRFPDKFKYDKAVNRDLCSERKVLEKK